MTAWDRARRRHRGRRARYREWVVRRRTGCRRRRSCRSAGRRVRAQPVADERFGVVGEQEEVAVCENDLGVVKRSDASPGRKADLAERLRGPRSRRCVEGGPAAGRKIDDIEVAAITLDGALRISVACICRLAHSTDAIGSGKAMSTNVVADPAEPDGLEVHGTSAISTISPVVASVKCIT